MSAQNEALVRRYIEEVYDQRKLEVIDEIFARMTQHRTLVGSSDNRVGELPA